MALIISLLVCLPNGIQRGLRAGHLLGMPAILRCHSYQVRQQAGLLFKIQFTPGIHDTLYVARQDRIP